MFGFRLVKDDQVGIVTKNMFGRKMLPGQIIAMNKETGVHRRQPGGRSRGRA
ncbi:MAG: hypothetical protein WBZ29_08530 [Methanocella sp.]